MTENETPAPQEPTFRFITGLGPTGPNQEIEFQVGYRIEDPNELVMGRPKVLGTYMPFQHLTKEHLEHLRHQINGAIGKEED